MLAALLSACTTVDGIGGFAGNGRANAPIPQKLAAQMQAKGMKSSGAVFVRIYKQESELELWKRDNKGQFSLLKTYPMCRWSGQLGPKKAEGDRQAPEGFYHVTKGMLNPESEYHLSFNLGFPNAYDRSFGRTGTALMVHGACTSSGCFAVTNEAVSELYSVLREAFNAGQSVVQVQSFPFRMTPENMALNRANPNFEFWQNLEEGADHFDATRQPPRVGVCNKKYIFNSLDPNADNGSVVAQCEPLEIDPALTSAISRKHSEHQSKAAELAQKAEPAAIIKYADGGMHPEFQSVLRSKGADVLQKRTSSKNAPVSRPKEALMSPVFLPVKTDPSASTSPCSEDATVTDGCTLQ